MIEILSVKRANSNTDVSALEAEIDRLVYQLYGLTEEEIAIVEGKGPTPNPSLQGGEPDVHPPLNAVEELTEESI